MSKAYSVRGLCYHICYSADELATHFGVHIQTVREWTRTGLSPIDNGKPHLFFGASVIQFINKLNDQRKIATEFNEFYCLSCHRSHSPLNHKISLTQDTGGFIRATGICGKSHIRMHKSYKITDISKLCKNFTVVDMSRLYDSDTTTVNTHIYPTAKQMNFTDYTGKQI